MIGTTTHTQQNFSALGITHRIADKITQNTVQHAFIRTNPHFAGHNHQRQILLPRRFFEFDLDAIKDPLQRNELHIRLHHTGV